MGLLGARNAGIEVPNEAIDKALSFFPSQHDARRCCLLSVHPAATVTESLGQQSEHWFLQSQKERTRQSTKPPRNSSRGDLIRTSTIIRFTTDTTWHKHFSTVTLGHGRAWNQRTIEQLQKMQNEDGSFTSSHGPAYGTGMSVLALALNYRLLPIYER